MPNAHPSWLPSNHRCVEGFHKIPAVNLASFFLLWSVYFKRCVVRFVNILFISEAAPCDCRFWTSLVLQPHFPARKVMKNRTKRILDNLIPQFPRHWAKQNSWTVFLYKTHEISVPPLQYRFCFIFQQRICIISFSKKYGIRFYGKKMHFWCGTYPNPSQCCLHGNIFYYIHA